MKIPSRKWVLIFVITAALFSPIVFVGYHWTKRIIARNQLKAAIAELDETEPGWKLSELEASRKRIPDKENGGPIVRAAAKLLPRDWPPKPPQTGVPMGPPSLPNLPPDHFQEIVDYPPQVRLNRNILEVLRQELVKFEPAITQARKLVNYSKGRYPIHLSPDGMATQVMHLDDCRKVTYLLCHHVILLLEEKHYSRAWNSLLAAINAGRTIGDESFIMSLLIRISCQNLALETMERVLAQGEQPECSLAKMQQVLETDIKEIPRLVLAAFKGDRAITHGTMTWIDESVKNGELSLKWIMDLKGKHEWEVTFWDRVHDFFAIEIVYCSHKVLLQELSRQVRLAELPLEEQIQAVKKFQWSNEINAELAFFARMLVPRIEKMLAECHRNQTLLRCAIATLAVEYYHVKHQRWPTNWDAVVSAKLLRGVPLDPFNQRPLQFRKMKNGVVIYSVGFDEVDNDGKLDRKKIKKPGTDLGFRLWDVAHRRQPPPPQ